MRLFSLVLFAVLVLAGLRSEAAAAAKRIDVFISYDPAVPTLDFACSELSAALEAKGLNPVLVKKGAEVAVGSPKAGWRINVGLLGQMAQGTSGLKKLEPEGFALRPSPKQKLIYVVGADARGAMYGVLDVTEHIELGGMLAKVPAKVEKPAVTIRSLKLNMPGWDDLNMSGLSTGEWDWFLSPDYWRSYFRMMARNRYNISTIWHCHPYHWMARIPKYPEATVLTDEQMERCHEAFSFIFAEAARHGIDTYLITWNIHYSPGLAKKHNLNPAGGRDTPVVRDYMREAIKAVLREYPGLTGIGTCPGEYMAGTAAENEAWLMDTYVAALLEVRGPDRFIHRYWGSEPKPMQQVFAAHYPGKVYLDLKYNGESMYSSPHPHFVDPVWLNQQPRNYEILWHLRNDDLYIMRWGDADFVRATLKHCVGPGIAGYVTGSEYERAGPDRLYTEFGKQYQTWTQDFEKHWYRFMLWGKLSYNASLPDSYFRSVFAARFGPKLGPKLLKTETAASKVLPLVDSFHWNYMNFDWAGESCMNPNSVINTARDGKGRNPNFRELGEYRSNFNNVREWIFNWTIDDDEYIGIPEYVGNLLAGVKKGSDEAKRMTPIEVADMLDRYASQVEAGLNEIKPQQAHPAYKEAVSWTWDLKLLALLGRYYAEKTRGGSDLLYYWCTGDTTAQQRARDSMKKCKEYWLQITDLGGKIYTFPKISIYPDLTWSKYLKDVDQDIAFTDAPAPFKTRTVTWSVMEPVNATDEQLKAYEESLENGAPSPIQLRDVAVKTTEIDVSGTGQFEFWLGMTNRKSKFLNLRRVWPEKESGVAYLRYQLPKSSKRWLILRNDLGLVSKIWYGRKLIYDSQKQESDTLKSGLAVLVEPGLNEITLRCDGVKGQDWGCSPWPDFKETYDISAETNGPDKVNVTVKNNFPKVEMKGLKITAIPWEPGWEAAPPDVTVNVTDDALVEFAIKQTDPSSVWTGVTIEADHGGERRLTGMFPPLPWLKTQPALGGDGNWRPELIGGKWAMVTQPETNNSFIYYQVDDKYLYDIDRDVKLTIEYYDSGVVEDINIQYDSHLPGPFDGSFHPEVGKTLGSMGWRKLTVDLPHARFANRANGHDLRLSGEADKRIRVRMVEVVP